MQNDSVINEAISQLDSARSISCPTRELLTAGPYYRINITSGVQGTNGVAYGGPFASYYFYINSAATLVDTVSPIVTALAPPNGSTVGDNVIFRATFSKPIDPLTVNANTFMVSGGGLTVMPSSITFDTTYQNVTVTPQTPMPDNATMTIAISGITDPSGNAVTPLTSTFTTLNGANTTQPTVVSTNILNSAVNVPINSPFVVQFSAAMDSRTLNGTNFFLYDYTTGLYIPATYSYSANGLTATLTPTSPLPVGTQFLFEIDNATDLAGNTVVSYTETFVTAFAVNSVAPTAGCYQSNSRRDWGSHQRAYPDSVQRARRARQPRRCETVAGRILGYDGAVGARAFQWQPNPHSVTPGCPPHGDTRSTISISSVADRGRRCHGTSPVASLSPRARGRPTDCPDHHPHSSPTSNQTNFPTNGAIDVSFSEQIDPLSLTNANFVLYNYAQGGRYLPPLP